MNQDYAQIVISLLQTKVNELQGQVIMTQAKLSLVEKENSQLKEELAKLNKDDDGWTEGEAVSEEKPKKANKK